MTGGLSKTSTRPLTAYLLGQLDPAVVEAFLARLVFDVSGGGTPAVVMCELTPGITIGREGSRLHVRMTQEQLHSHQWPIRWVTRGGGAMLHLPGQICCYPILPLDVLELKPACYVSALNRIALELCHGLGVTGAMDPQRPGVRCRGRRLISIGVGIRSRVTTFGLTLNVTSDLEPFRDINCDGDTAPMTSLLREAPAPVRMQAVRQRLLDLLAASFGYNRITVFHDHPTFLNKPTRHAAIARN